MSLYKLCPDSNSSKLLGIVKKLNIELALANIGWDRSILYAIDPKSEIFPRILDTWASLIFDENCDAIEAADLKNGPTSEEFPPDKSIKSVTSSIVAVMLPFDDIDDKNSVVILIVWESKKLKSGKWDQTSNKKI